ncbi:hypothetical protein [Streptomyces sp. NPDC055210]
MTPPQICGPTVSTIHSIIKALLISSLAARSSVTAYTSACALSECVVQLTLDCIALLPDADASLDNPIKFEGITFAPEKKGIFAVPTFCGCATRVNWAQGVTLQVQQNVALWHMVGRSS